MFRKRGIFDEFFAVGPGTGKVTSIGSETPLRSRHENSPAVSRRGIDRNCRTHSPEHFCYCQLQRQPDGRGLLRRGSRYGNYPAFACSGPEAGACSYQVAAPAAWLGQGRATVIEGRLPAKMGGL